MKEIKCDECKEVVMKLAKGSEYKPDIYVSHEVCEKSREPISTGEFHYPDVDAIKDFLGIKT